MRHTVTWTAEASDQLTGIWLAAAAPIDVTDAADRLDQILRNDPDRAGEDLEFCRTMVIEPLEFAFVISPQDRLVRVISVTLFGAFD